MTSSHDVKFFRCSFEDPGDQKPILGNPFLETILESCTCLDLQVSHYTQGVTVFT